MLVLPSWPEGLGRVVIEAFARGRGVVATDGGGIPDLVDDGVEGFLVPPADTDALAQRSSACSRTASSPSGSALPRRERYADWHSTPERARGATAASSSTRDAGRAD